MAKRANRPSLFGEQGANMLGNLAQNIMDDTIQAGAEMASEEGADVKVMPNYLVITQKRMESHGVIDLKPYFARSMNRQYTKGKKGENPYWFMVIPIKRTRRSFTTQNYEKLREMTTDLEAGEEKTVELKGLMDRVQNMSPVSGNHINPRKQSKNITAVARQWGSGTRNTYYAYRTVSEKSPANSWIINRKNVNEDDMSQTLIQNIDRLFKWRLKNE